MKAKVGCPGTKSRLLRESHLNLSNFRLDASEPFRRPHVWNPAIKLPVAETNLNWGQARYPGGTRENQDRRIPIGKPYLALFHNILRMILLRKGCRPQSLG
jgi:hypothetical protein